MTERKLVKNIMRGPVLTVKATAPLSKVAEILVRNNLKSLPVVDDHGNVVGVISNCDVIGVWSRDPDLIDGLNAKDAMTPFVITVEPENTLREVADRLAREKVHQVFVLSSVKGKKRMISKAPEMKVVGAISAKDLLQEISQYIVPITVKDVMHGVTTIDSEASVAEAGRVMTAKEIGSILVAKNGEPIGMLTERDILRKVVAAGLDPATTKVSQVMSAPLITIPSTTGLDVAGKKMIDKKIRRLLVTENEKIIGIVTARDMVRGMAVKIVSERKHL